MSWLSENWSLLRLRSRLREKDGEVCRGVLARVDMMSDLYRRLTGMDMRSAKIVELGYGQRPLQLFALSSLGYGAMGIDLDQPLLKGSARELIVLARSGGLKRLLKSVVRHFAFDRSERRRLDAALRERGASLRIDRSIFRVGDAAQMELPADSVDLIYSEDVFEHIPYASLEKLCRRMQNWLRPGGIAIIAPDIFTGISGGHLPEWYGETIGHKAKRRAEPWDHLRRRRRAADCYLNEMRIADYRNLFQRHFEIVNEWNEHRGRGREFLTEDIRRELSDYSDEDLLAGRHFFILRKAEPASAT